jgi:hypothetical protein
MQFEVSRKIMYWYIPYPLTRANILPVSLSIFILTPILLDGSNVYGNVNLHFFVLFKYLLLLIHLICFI